jgi:hypothetical protein
MPSSSTITYVHSDITDDGRIAVAAISDEPGAGDVLHALAFVRNSKGTWSGCQLNNRLVGIHLSHSGESFDALGVAIDGGVCEITASKPAWSLVEIGSEGPNTLVPLITSRRVGGAIIAAGMQRRMYAMKRSGWSRIDDGLRIPFNDLSIGGILSVDGSSIDRLWTAGYGGEIWRRDDASWQQVDSPTNAKLIALRQRPDGSVLVAGANGVAFIGDGRTWRAVDGLDPYPAIAVECYRGDTYVAVRGGGLYVLQASSLERVEDCVEFPVYSMSSCASSLLAVGPFGLRMLDASGWHTVEPPIPVQRP